MVKHVILWTLKEDLSEAKKKRIKADIKESLEGLCGQIPGLMDMRVRIKCLPTSTADIMMESVFLDAEALEEYSVHPKHVEVAENKVRPYTAVRSCMDYKL